MKIMQGIRVITSALEQAGVDTLEFHNNSIDLVEIAGATLIGLHSKAEAQPVDAGPFQLPAKTGQCSGEDPAILCLRPGEWLFFSQSTTPQALLETLQNPVRPDQSTGWNQSDGLAVFRLTGTGAPWLLSKLSCLDYALADGATPHCARTRMGHIAVIVHYHRPVGGPFAFDLILDRSLARYLWELLQASAAHADELCQTFGTAA